MQPTTGAQPQIYEDWPDHLGLPDRDHSIVVNTQEHPQSNILTECLLPKLHERHPDGNFFVGCDVGIYFTYTDPVLDGCRAPDWFYVPGVAPMLDGQVRRSYVMWKELVNPAVIVEYVSGDGSEERDNTPRKGKFWLYQHPISAGYYVIFDPWQRALEVFARTPEGFAPVRPNEAGRFAIPILGVELGIWDGKYRGIEAPWLRVWDGGTMKMLPLDAERAEQAEEALDETRGMLTEQIETTEAERKRAESEKARAESEKARAESEKARAEKLAAKLRELGIDPAA